MSMVEVDSLETMVFVHSIPENLYQEIHMQERM